MKKSLILAAIAITGLASCGSDLLVDNDNTINEKSDVITFENTLTNNSTRAVKTAFANGDAMGIYGFQDRGTTNGDQVFVNQKVSYDGAKWTYSPLKYWNAGSTYEFFGIYPRQDEGAKTYTFDGNLFTITDFDAASGTDIMIAEKNTTPAFSTVNMNFNHLLSNVNFKSKLASTVGTTSIASIQVAELEITGLKSIGTFTQSGFNTANGNVYGKWNDLNGKFEFKKDAATTIALGSTATEIIGNLAMPQPLTATLKVKYVINYSDRTSTSFVKIIPLESIKAGTTPITKWDMNTVYNYTMILDPSKFQQATFDPNCIDWDGSNGDSDNDGNGDLDKSKNSKLVGPDADGNYWVEVDTDGDGTYDTKYPVVWEDIDGDGLLEGGVDRDGDGHIDNVDGDNTNGSDSGEPGHNNVTDGNTNNPDGKDVILVDTNDDGIPDAQLERDPTYKVGPENPTDAPNDSDPDNKSGKKYTIDWNGSLDEDGNASSNAADETKPVKYSRLVLDADGEYYVEFDNDRDGVYNSAGDTRVKVLWADLDGDGRLEGYLGNKDNNDTNNGSSLATDGNSRLNPDGYDVIIIDTDGDGVCDTQLEKICNGTVYPSDALGTAITFDASIENWSNFVNGEVTINPDEE